MSKPVAFCAPGRRAETAIILALRGEEVEEIRESPLLGGERMVLVVAAELALWEPREFPIEPTPFPVLETYECPGCFTRQYQGLCDPSSHLSFCWIMHPPLRPLNLGGLIGGI